MGPIENGNADLSFLNGLGLDYRGPLSTVYNDEEISTCGLEVHSVQSTMMGRSQHVGRL